MKSQPDPPAELLALCDRLLDGELTEADRADLEARVLRDPAQRRCYVEYLHLHATLRQQASRLADAPLAEVLRSMPAAASNVVRPRFAWSLKLAAALALGAGLAWSASSFLRRNESVATLVEVKNARWESSALPTEPGSKLGRGRLRLIDGLARVTFRSGAEVSLEGPAELELVNRNACFLHSGALVAHVPEPAHGFVVATAHAKLIDHGTDFGISADAVGRAQVQVLQGEVELRHDRSGETLQLATRQSASITPERLNSRIKDETEPDRHAFTRSESGAPPVTLTTSTGAGDAAYVVSPNSPTHFSDTLLLVKNAPDAKYRRKAFLRFDLASLNEQRIADATLTLNFEATGFGYASLTGACTFAVYGVTDDAQDAWSAASLTWENAPAFSPDAGAVELAKAKKLGTFNLPAGVVSGAYSIEGAALADFLNADTNRRATLIVVRETSEARLNAAVHGFAGNHHPTLAPPTLRLTMAGR
jgi:hypothetical protein